jgi:hypothetical protein
MEEEQEQEMGLGRCRCCRLIQKEPCHMFKQSLLSSLIKVGEEVHVCYGEMVEECNDNKMLSRQASKSIVQGTYDT